MKPLPPTALALLRALHDAGGAIPYRDPRVTTSGLTALRHRGLAGVSRRWGAPEVRLSDAGAVEAARVGAATVQS